MQTQTAPKQADGILEIHPDGYGFLRSVSLHCGAGPEDAFVPAELIRKFGLREGVLVSGDAKKGAAKPDNRRNNNNNGRRGNNRNNRRNNNGNRNPGPRLSTVETIEGQNPETYVLQPSFDALTPIDPQQWLKLETEGSRLTTRVIDMFTPIGKGQRGLIVAPPRSGKTVLIQHIAEGISTNHPDVELIVLLVDERPEEVTEMRRCIQGQVFASSNDRETASHVRLAQLVIERAKRLVEAKKDVVVLLDSITRLARAYNRKAGNTGRTMSGGLDVRALEIPKRLFGSARAFEEGGSLTVMATALIETGSRMDDVIFQEFKGTGNMELVLDRKLADRRVYPAIDILQSGTRKEERLLPKEDLERITLLRRSITQMNPIQAMETLLAQMGKHESNAAFLNSLSRFV